VTFSCPTRVVVCRSALQCVAVVGSGLYTHTYAFTCETNLRVICVGYAYAPHVLQCVAVRRYADELSHG